MTNWKLDGTYFETCNCESACPCVFLSPPTEGNCTVLVAWHINKGHFGDVALDGLNVALAVYSPGNMIGGEWKAAAYFDDKADKSQNEALHMIFSGKAGGHPAVLVSLIGEMVGARNVPMQYSADGRNSSLTSNHPLCIAPGIPATAARSSHFTFKDFGFDWKLSGRNGFMSEFVYQAG